VHDDPGGFQIAADGFATDRERLLDAPKRSSEPSERKNLLLLVVVQDVAHDGDGTRVPRRRQRLDRYREWPVFSCRSMAGFGCPPRRRLTSRQAWTTAMAWPTARAFRFCHCQLIRLEEIATILGLLVRRRNKLRGSGSLARRTRMASSPLYVYLLQSTLDPQQYYVGLTANPQARLTAHNAGESRHTARFRPWRTVVTVEFTDGELARAFERYLKSGSGREFTRRHFR
jgi:putative endonuclease